ncbi:nuclear transport factor 2 family protein [Sphingobium sp. HWE2-09]|uniref:nuclear transport factor 2 family protein n=1 Tax=Sphingobium sp. HWE2-09 TaxID=3108390 RepID=UPI002DD0A8D6|nr:nuclear transport factor 2 family protein [Sphingobium sp. HWE2-09]
MNCGEAHSRSSNAEFIAPPALDRLSAESAAEIPMRRYHHQMEAKMKMETGRAETHRRAFLAGSLVGVASFLPKPSQAAVHDTPFDRTAYDRYIQLMNKGDLQFADYYADDIQFVMNIRGKAGVLAFYARQRPYIRETLKILFFCSDRKGAAAQVHSEVHCIRDCDDTTLFGRALKVGEHQTIRGCLLYSLNDQGKIIEINGPPPEILTPWRMDAI